jgi:hypothetical protein
MKTISGMLGSQRGYGIASLSVSLPLAQQMYFKSYPKASKVDLMSNLTSNLAYDTIGEESAVMNVVRGASKDNLPNIVDFIDSYRVPSRSNTLVTHTPGFKVGETFPGIYENVSRDGEVGMLGRLSMRSDVKGVVDRMQACVGDKRRWGRNIDLDLGECDEILKTMSHLYEEL